MSALAARADARPASARRRSHAPVRRTRERAPPLPRRPCTYGVRSGSGSLRSRSRSPHERSGPPRPHNDAPVLAQLGRAPRLLVDDPCRDRASAKRVAERAASIRDVSRTSPTSSARRDVSSPISARNDSRCSGVSSASAPECRAPRRSPRPSAARSWETSETKSPGAPRGGEARSTIARSASRRGCSATAVATRRPSRVTSSTSRAERSSARPRER